MTSALREVLNLIKSDLNNLKYYFKHLKSNKLNILFLFILMFIIFIYFYLFLLPAVFLLSLINVFFLIININNNNYIYKVNNIIDKIKILPNNKIYILYVYFIRQPVVYSYLITYLFLYFCFNKTPSLNIWNKLFTIIYRLGFRLIFGVPYFILLKACEILKKIQELNEFNYETKLDRFWTIYLNLSVMYDFDFKFTQELKIYKDRSNNWIFNPLTDEEIKLMAYFLSNIEKNLFSSTKIIYAKLRESKKFHYYFVLSLSKGDPKINKDFLLMGLTTKDDIIVKMKSEFFPVEEFEFRNYIKTGLLEKSLNKNYVGMLTQNWFSIPQLANKTELILKTPKFFSNIEEAEDSMWVENISNSELPRLILRNLLYNMTTVYPEEDYEGHILINYTKPNTPFLSFFTENDKESRVFENAEINKNFSELFKLITKKKEKGDYKSYAEGVLDMNKALNKLNFWNKKSLIDKMCDEDSLISKITNKKI